MDLSCVDQNDAVVRCCTNKRIPRKSFVCVKERPQCHGEKNNTEELLSSQFNDNDILDRTKEQTGRKTNSMQTI